MKSLTSSFFLIFFISNTPAFGNSLTSNSEHSVSTEKNDEPSNSQVTWDQLKSPRYLWENELKPTLYRSFDQGGKITLVSGALLTVATHQYDHDIHQHNEVESKKLFNSDVANIGASLGSGTPGIAIALTQLIFDRTEGVAHAKAIALTSLSHITIASIVQRDRPNKRNKLSFPSGHASSSFATATSLAYSYGYPVGVPAYLLASFVALSRVNENIHWASDVVAGAALGIFWGRASANFDRHSDYTLVPSLSNDYAGLNLIVPLD